MSKVVFFDLETTGLDPSIHKIVQIAAVAVCGQTFRELDRFERKVKFDADAADPIALTTIGWDERKQEWQEDAVEEMSALRDFGYFIKQHATLERVSKKGFRYKVAQMAAHNAKFDMGFIEKAFRAAGIFFPGDYHPLDTIAIAQVAQWLGVVKFTNLKLETLHFSLTGAKLEGAHDAFVDVRATVEIARRMRAMFEERLVL